MRGYEGVIAAATANCQPRNGEEPPGWDWERPTYSALPLASSFAGYLAATSIVMALIARQRTGRGQHVEVPLFDAMFTLIGHSGAYSGQDGPRPPQPIHGRGAGAFRCQDGRYVQFDTSSARHLTWFARTAGLLGRFDPELLDLSGNCPAGGQRAAARTAAGGVRDPHRGGVGAGRQRGRRRHRLHPDARRVDRHQPGPGHARGRAGERPGSATPGARASRSG